MIYKILRESEMAELKANGKSQGAPIDIADGYIHFSMRTQLAATLAKHFAGEVGLYLLAYDENTLSRLKWEEARGGDLFPHLYAPLELTFAKSVWKLDGHHLPEGL